MGAETASAEKYWRRNVPHRYSCHQNGGIAMVAPRCTDLITIYSYQCMGLHGRTLINLLHIPGKDIVCKRTPLMNGHVSHHQQLNVLINHPINAAGSFCPQTSEHSTAFLLELHNHQRTFCYQKGRHRDREKPWRAVRKQTLLMCQVCRLVCNSQTVTLGLVIGLFKYLVYSVRFCCHQYE